MSQQPGRSDSDPTKIDRTIGLPVLDSSHSRAPMMGRTRAGRIRAVVLTLVNVLMIAHLIQWAIVGMTISPIEPSETMETLEVGVVNAGAIFFLLAILITLVFGRFFCGWLCHVVALQDLCAWIMTKAGIRPKPFRSRLLVYFPIALGMYMFVWPSFKRLVLAPALESASIDWPFWLRPVEPIHQWSTGLVVDDFWATMPPWYIAVPFLFICGFAAVYFLGAKGFCTYGCPYAAFFKPIDTIAPVRVRVNNNCHQCGYCTSACTSNVRVSEEVRDFGMVVDPGCMKTLDCISACPNDALSLGIGRPALGAKPRSPETRKKALAKRRGRYDMSMGEELLAVVLMLWFFFATRGMLDAVPMLLAGGLAAIGTMILITSLKLLYTKNVRLYGLKFKQGGKVRPAGIGLVLVAGVFVIGSLWSGQARLLRWRGDMLYTRAQVPTTALLRPEFDPSPAQIKHAETAVESYQRADSFSDGGMGWALNAEHRLRLSYFLSVLDRHGEALEELRRVISEGEPTDALVLQAGQVLIRSVDDHPPTGLSAQQVEDFKRIQLLALYDSALSAHPGLHAIRVELSRGAYSVGEHDKAQAYWSGNDEYADDPLYTLSHAGYVGFTGDIATTRELLESAGEQSVSLDRPAGMLIDISRSALQYGIADLALDLAQRAIDDPSATALTWLAAGEIANAAGQADLGTQRGEHALGMPGLDTPMLRARAAGVILKPGKIERGRSLLGEAIEQSKDPFERFFIARGMVFAGNGLGSSEMLEEGLAAMANVVDTNADLYILGHDYSSLLYSLGRQEEALEQLIKVAEADSENAVFAQRAAEMSGALGRDDLRVYWEEQVQVRSSP